jgi:hypothetical protein
MLARRLISTVAVLGALAGLSGCDLLKQNGADAGSSTNGAADGGAHYPPPTLDDWSMPSSADPGTDGFYTLIGTISFHDDSDQAVHFIRVRVPVIGKTYDFPAGDLASAIGAEFEMKLSDDVPLGGAGQTNYQVSLVDIEGDESTPVTETVYLQ